MPRVFGANLLALTGAAVLLGMGVTAFVPMGAVFPALAPKEQGAAISVNNLASGLTTFAGPGLVTLLLPVVGVYLHDDFDIEVASPGSTCIRHAFALDA